MNYYHILIFQLGARLRKMKLILVVSLFLLQISCTGIPNGIEPIDNFNLNKYLGNWYEIARLDHSFERGLSHVTANYSVRTDGGLTVLNRGFSAKDNEWNTAEGRAYFVGNKALGHLKVSFFGPFYGSYVIFKVDEPNYQYAYVTSYNKDFLWLLSRTPELSDEIKKDFVETTKKLGFDTKQLIYVKQN